MAAYRLPSLLLLALGGAAGAAPSGKVRAAPAAMAEARPGGPTTPPAFPTAFAISFHERISYGPVERETEGRMLFDAESAYGPAERVDREDGIADRYCGTAKPFRKTPCSHIVANQTRYLAFPELKECCYCCDSTHGCGPLTVDWTSNASYVGPDTVDGTDAEKWSVHGLQDNFYWVAETSPRVPDPLPLRILQQPDDDMVFKGGVVGKPSPEEFVLPPQLDCTKACGGTCALVRRERRL